MPLFAIPVVVPYKLEPGPQAVVYSLAVEAVASNNQAAIATARIILETQVRLIHNRKPIPLLDRCSTDRAISKIKGPYAYVFTSGDRIPHLEFPARLEENAGTNLEEALAGLKEPWVHGVVLDCAPIQYIASRGLAAIAAHAKRLNLQMFRVPENMSKILSIVGLNKHLSIHPDLAGALNGLLHRQYTRRLTEARRQSPTTTVQAR